MSSLSGDEQVSRISRKVAFLAVIVILFYGIILSRLFYLQIYRGKDYRILSEQISVREEELRARRGLILDRKGKVLADNRSYLEVVIIPQDLGDRDQPLSSLARLIGLTREEIKDKLNRARGHPPFFPVVLVSDAPYEMVSRIREYQRPDDLEQGEMVLKGVQVRSTYLRLYRYPELFSHVLGYLKEIDQATLERLSKEKSPERERYSMGDLMGAAGVESAYDLDLRGIDGVKARVVDAQGKEIRDNPEIASLAERGSTLPVDGHHLMTTLDFKAQEEAAKALGDRRGAVVALDPQSGEVLVLYSSPGFDGNRIMGEIDREYWKKINLDENKYLYNRAIQAAYPPGSTYKVVGAFAGLETGIIKPESHFGCGGGLQFGNRYFHCWNKGGHGSVEIIRGIMQSCDVFFYNVGLKVGVDGLDEYARKLGLGAKTGIEIPYEQGGLIPSSEWKMKRFKQPWIQSETLSIAIGQGYDLATPLQNARMIAIIANGGRMITPHLGKMVLGNNRQVLRTIETTVGPPFIKPEVLDLIQKGLIGVVHGAGTAGRLRSSPHKIAGKTGTAQVIGYESKAARGERTKDHAWFVAYAPYDDPKIAVSVIVENGGHGGAAAAPVAQAVIDAYLGESSNAR